MDHVDFVLKNLTNLLVGFPTQRPGGLLLNFIYAVLSILIAFALSLPIGWGRVSRVRLLRWGCAAYIEVIRGMPLILIVFWVYSYGTIFGYNLSPFLSALIGLVLFGSSYLAETIGAGLNAVPHVQVEAARSDGLTPLQIATHIRFPQALLIVLPDLTSLFITIFKDSSVTLIIGAGELMYTAQAILSSSGANAKYLVSLYFAVSLMFFAGALSISRALAWVERRFEVPGRLERPSWRLKGEYS